MLKNLTPLIIVLVVIVAGALSVFFISNQNTQSNLDLNLTPTIAQNPSPTSAIISPVSQDAPASTSSSITTMPDGLQIQDITVGSGQEVKSGNTVTVHYIGTLQNGEKFDSSYDRNAPFATQIGVGTVIKGWDEGIVGMRVGGKRKLIIPPDLGYGPQDYNGIPGNSTLIFEVELLAVK